MRGVRVESVLAGRLGTLSGYKWRAGRPGPAFGLKITDGLVWLSVLVPGLRRPGRLCSRDADGKEFRWELREP